MNLTRNTRACVFSRGSFGRPKRSELGTDSSALVLRFFASNKLRGLSCQQQRRARHFQVVVGTCAYSLHHSRLILMFWADQEYGDPPQFVTSADKATHLDAAQG